MHLVRTENDRHDVLGIGNAIVDILAYAEEDLVVELGLVRGVRREGEGLGVALLDEDPVDEDAVLGARDVGQQAVVAVTGLDVALEPHPGPRRQELGGAVLRLRPEALDRDLLAHRLGGVDPDEPDTFASPGREPDVERVAVDDTDDLAAHCEVSLGGGARGCG